MTAIEGVNTTQNTTITANQASLQAQITAINTRIDNLVLSFPAGTMMIFFQAAPPVGWNYRTDLHDYAIRIVGSGAGGGAGAVPFSTVFSRQSTDAMVLSVAQMPAHAHGTPMQGLYGSGSVFWYFPVGGGFAGSTSGTDTQGGNAAHAHNIDLRVTYLNCCVGQKT
jgi:hypothetical protein